MFVFNSTLSRSLAIGLLLLSLSAISSGQSASQRIKFSFDGYGNPQRPFPGYVGPFQLGPSRIQGSGEINRRTGAVISGGRIGHSDDLLGGRYRSHRTNWQVVRLLNLQSSGGVTTLRLGVRVVSSNIPSICPVGTYGIVELVDDNRLLSNRLTADSIRTEMPNPSASNSEGTLACGTHTHGMNNDDYSWTEPPRGGYGIWANVAITGGAKAPLQITRLRYPQNIRWNGPRGNMTVYWKGDPQFPLRVIFAPRTCPAGVNGITETRTFNAPTNPFMATQAVWCAGPGGFTYKWDYEVYLQDATGAISNRVRAPGVCR
ncbi:MAG: hypothetical protein WBO10_08225 [Pyrinomonadaceae bacterium]